MLPWGHAALGYMFYTAYARLRYRHPPVGLTVYALGLGTQFPDLIDKPLAWHLAVLPSGRSLAHSLFTLVVIVGALWFAFDAPEQRRLTAAFSVGWVSHLVGDGVFAVLRGRWVGVHYLLWPVTSYSGGPGDRNVLTFFFHLELTPHLWVGVALTGVVLCVWLIDGAPGVADVLRGRYGTSADEKST